MTASETNERRRCAFIMCGTSAAHVGLAHARGPVGVHNAHRHGLSFNASRSAKGPSGSTLAIWPP
eukprot:6864989-Pyramimonas_sp.AAC.1